MVCIGLRTKYGLFCSGNFIVNRLIAEENFKTYSDQLFRLLQHVRLPLAKPQFLFDIVQAEPLIKQNRYSPWSSSCPVFRLFAPIFDEEGNQNWLRAKSCVMFESCGAEEYF